jgi:hypothetical protein
MDLLICWCEHGMEMRFWGAWKRLSGPNILYILLGKSTVRSISSELQSLGAVARYRSGTAHSNLSAFL